MRKKGRIITDFQGTTYSAELPKGNYHHTEWGGWWQMRPPSPHDSRTMNVRKSCADRGGSSAPAGFEVRRGAEGAVTDVLRGSVG